MFDEVLNTPLKFGPSFFSHHFAKPEKNEDFHNIWDKVFKNGPTKICGRQSLKNFAWSILEYSVPFLNLFSMSSSSFFLNNYEYIQREAFILSF